MLAIAVSIVIAVLLVLVGYVDRDEAGSIRWSGCIWTLVGMSIVCGWLAAGYVMWADPDRLREGAAYWLIAVPVFGIGYCSLSLACLLTWWVLRRILKRGWIPAILVPLAASPLLGPWGAGAALVACFGADQIFSKRRLPAKDEPHSDGLGR